MNITYIFDNVDRYSSEDNAPTYLKHNFLINVFIIKTKVIVPQAQVTVAYFGDPVQALWFTCSKNVLNYLAF